MENGAGVCVTMGSICVGEVSGILTARQYPSFPVEKWNYKGICCRRALLFVARSNVTILYLEAPAIEA